jgi:hypothetical protein
MRLLKVQFPNLKMVFLQARTYGGYATKEPRIYENGFAVKWLIQAQITQMATGVVDPIAGDLGYLSSTSTDNSAPWVAWGPYTWGAGAIPRLDGQSWPGGDFAFDGIHPSECLFYGIQCGRKHTSDLMISFFTDPTNGYTAPWFLIPGA